MKFQEKFRKHKEKFKRYYIADCETAEETEELESSLVDRVILADPKCLNLVAGGSGTTRHPSIAETSAKKREHMLNNPEQYEPMLAAAKKAFQSGSTPALRARSERIREVMGAEKYREMMSKRIKNWKEEKPEAYAEARRKSRAAIRSTEVQEKRVASLKKWVQKNPEKHKTWEENRIRALASEESKAKRKASLKAWREKNPEQARDNARRRGQASAAKNRKAVCMIDLQTGRVLKEFPSQRAAAQWLVENGKAKNMNCVSSISSVCLRRPCSTGYGHRKKAYGYDWRFKSDIADAG